MTLFPQAVVTAAVQQFCPHEYVRVFFTLVMIGGMQLVPNRCAGISCEYYFVLAPLP